MTIKQIFSEIANESSTNQKMVILGKYKNDPLLRRVLYMANSKRVKFYIKQIPVYEFVSATRSLEDSLDTLMSIANRVVTGGKAIDVLYATLAASNPENAFIIERIIEKDCKIGMGTSNINKIFPKLIEDTPYMGAKAFSEELARKIFKDGPAVSQVKMDGRYTNAIIRGGDVELESRQGEPTILEGAAFLKELQAFPVDCVLNGELTMDGVSRYESNGIIASLIDITGKANTREPEETMKKVLAFEAKHGKFDDALNAIRFTAWDIISVEDYFNAASKKPYIDRLANLVLLLDKQQTQMVSIIESREVKTYEEAMAHFQEALAKGLEGTVLKSLKGAWKDGKPNWQVKMKLEITVDLRIISFNYGTGKNLKVISSLNATSSDGKVVTKPTGINEEMMQYITDNQEKLTNTIVEVKCCGLSQDSASNYSLLHPVFQVLRDDKDTCDSLEDIKAIEAMAKGLSIT